MDQKDLKINFNVTFTIDILLLNIMTFLKCIYLKAYFYSASVPLNSVANQKFLNGNIVHVY